MAVPLLGLLGLAGGALGQDWYLAEEAKKGQAKLAGLLGSAPDPVPDGGYANPNPGSGLMADPASIQRQLEFAAGVMGLRPRDRAAAHALVEPILGRASQAALSREGWGRSEGLQREGWANSERQYQQTETRIGGQFEQTMQANRERFNFDVQKYGEEQAWERKKWGDSQALAWSSEARQANTAQLTNALTRLQIEAKLNPPIDLPQGYRAGVVPGGPMVPGAMPRGVMGPGAPTDAGRVVAIPVQGTKPWEEAQDKVNVVNEQLANLDAYREHLKKHGTQRFGPESGEQATLYSRVRTGIGALNLSGVMNVGDVPIVEAELPNPTTMMRGYLRDETLLAQLDALEASYRRRHDNAKRQYQGWGLNYGEAGGKPEAEKGRDAPPPGSKKVGR